jgi:hypothetical protein
MTVISCTWYWNPTDQIYQAQLSDGYRVEARGLANRQMTELEVYSPRSESVYEVRTINCGASGPKIDSQKGNPNELLERKDALTRERIGLPRNSRQGLLRIINLVGESISDLDDSDLNFIYAACL